MCGRDVLHGDNADVAEGEQERQEPRVVGIGHPARRAQALLPSAGSPRRHGFGFWAVTTAFTAVTALTTVPSVLYGIYRARDGFSLFMLTVVFAVYAVAIVVTLLVGGHLSDWLGRRRILIAAGAVVIASAVVFLLWRSLPGLLVARALTGIGMGMTLGTATAYLEELHAGHRPEAGPARAQLVATTVNLGGLGIGALVSGVAAQWVADPLTVPYVIFLVVLVVALAAVAVSPETRPALRPRPRYRPQRLSLPARAKREFYAAALGTLVVFAVVGLFSGLAGTFLAVSLHHSSRALLGAILFAAYSAGVIGQLITISWPLPQQLRAGMTSMLLGLPAIAGAVWLSPPSLALFIVGGAVSLAGAGTVFQAALADVTRIAPPHQQAEIVASTYVAAAIGLSVPTISAGIALAEGVASRVTLLALVSLIAGAALSASSVLGAAHR